MAKYWKYVLVGICRGQMTVLDKHIVHRSASGIYAIKEGRTCPTWKPMHNFSL